MITPATQPTAAAGADMPRDSKVLSIPELRGLLDLILDQSDPRVQLPDVAYRRFIDDVAQAAATALGYEATPADWLEEWLVSFYLTEESPADGGILADPQLDPDVQDEFMAGVAARRARPA